MMMLSTPTLDPAAFGDFSELAELDLLRRPVRSTIVRLRPASVPVAPVVPVESAELEGADPASVGAGPPTVDSETEPSRRPHRVRRSRAPAGYVVKSVTSAADSETEDGDGRLALHETATVTRADIEAAQLSGSALPATRDLRAHPDLVMAPLDQIPLWGLALVRRTAESEGSRYLFVPGATESRQDSLKAAQAAKTGTRAEEAGQGGEGVYHVQALFAGTPQERLLVSRVQRNPWAANLVTHDPVSVAPTELTLVLGAYRRVLEFHRNPEAFLLRTSLSEDGPKRHAAALETETAAPEPRVRTRPAR
jgi:hypothetical protein